MKLKQFFFFFPFLLTTSSCLFAESKPVLEFNQVMANRFAAQVQNAIQEKVYLQTDKPYYSAGENIWIKSYLVNATTLRPNAFSKFVYIELIDKKDSVYYRIKLKSDSLGFAGHIKLAPEIPAGKYALRAYTSWMQNAGPEFFFSKNIFIGNEIDNRISSQISYGQVVDGMIPVTLTFTDASQNPVAAKKVEIMQCWQTALKKKLIAETDKAGMVKWNVSVDSNDVSKKYFGVSLPSEKYVSKIFLPEFSSDYDIQFFPESGVLLNNSLQTVAFKVIGRNGLSIEATGQVFNQQNELISGFSTYHKGMGKFSMLTQPGESYYAIVKSEKGIEKKVHLPKVQENGITLNLLNYRGKILYNITNQINIPTSNLYLLVHFRGNLVALEKLNKPIGIITDSLLPAGINSFSIIDSLGNIYCERLSFNRNFKFPVVNMSTDKPSYKKHENVKLNLNIQSIFQNTVNGSFSISITDSHSVKQDSLGENILTSLLLTSDIKGFVEEPAAYFADNSIITREKADLLMMTQGWRRFNTTDVLKAIYKTPKYELEMGQVLSGKVINLLKKPSKNAEIVMLSPYKNMLRTTKTDSLGRYFIDRIEFPDCTSFLLKAKKPKSITDVEIIPDQDNFPDSDVNIPIPLQMNYTQEQSDYFKLGREKYYSDGGMRIVNLEGIVVTAEKITKNQSEYYTGLADSELSSDMLQKYPHAGIIALLSTISGIQATDDRISIRGSGNNPMIMVDDFEVMDIQEITYLTSDQIESIQVFKGVSASVFGSRGANGVIAITLRKGVNLKTPTQISLAHIIPLGYQKAEKFYVPTYDVANAIKDSRPDLRTTIYWNPKLQTDKNGIIQVEFPTADKANDYTVIFEGVTTSGELCRYVGKLKRTDK